MNEHKHYYMWIKELKVVKERIKAKINNKQASKNKIQKLKNRSSKLEGLLNGYNKAKGYYQALTQEQEKKDE